MGERPENVHRQRQGSGGDAMVPCLILHGTLNLKFAPLTVVERPSVEPEDGIRNAVSVTRQTTHICLGITP